MIKSWFKGKKHLNCMEKIYWYHWFSNTKKNRAKKRFSKGFVEIKYITNE